MGAPPLTRTMSMPACNLDGSRRERYPFPLFVLEQCSCFEGKGQTKPLRGKKKPTNQMNPYALSTDKNHTHRGTRTWGPERGCGPAFPYTLSTNQSSTPMPKRYTHLLTMSRFVCVNRCINLITCPHDSCTGIRCSCEKEPSIGTYSEPLGSVLMSGRHVQKPVERDST